MTELKEPGTMTDDIDLLDLIDKASRFWKAYKKIIFLFSALNSTFMSVESRFMQMIQHEYEP